MSTGKLNELPDRELDAAVAEKVMGWVKFFATDPIWTLPNGVELPDGEFHPPRYSTDRNAAGLVLERIGELGLQRRFINILWHEKTVWDLLTATPRQLCEVAFACVEKEPNAQ